MNKCNPIPCDCKDGKVGMTGLKGSDGSDGAMGIEGIQGLQGNQGEQGDVGEQGSVGNISITGDSGASIIVGDQGSQGPLGDAGINGLDGEKGPPGINGIRGDDAPNYITSIQNIPCPPLPPSIPNYENTYCAFNAGTNSRWVIAHPSGQYRTSLSGSWNSTPPAIGGVTTFIGTINCSKWIISVKLGQRFQMSGGLVTSASTDTIIGGGVTLPTDGQIKFAPSNYSDSITLLHIGNDEHVVISINNAGGVLPTFI